MTRFKNITWLRIIDSGMAAKKNKMEWYTIAALVIACEMFGAVTSGMLLIIKGGLFWYDTLSKQLFSVPGGILAVVWIIVYLLMAVALYKILEKRKRNKAVKCALAFFCIMVLFALIRTFFFSGLQYIDYGLVVASLFWIFATATTVKFWHISKQAAMFMLPVVVWATFTIILTISMYALNPV